MEKQLNEFIGVYDNQTMTYNKDITMTDIEGNQKVIVKCMCTIQAYQSISFYMDVLERDVFMKYKDIIQAEVDRYKAEATQIAINHNVPVL